MNIFKIELTLAKSCTFPYNELFKLWYKHVYLWNEEKNNIVQWRIRYFNRNIQPMWPKWRAGSALACWFMFFPFTWKSKGINQCVQPALLTFSLYPSFKLVKQVLSKRYAAVWALSLHSGCFHVGQIPEIWEVEHAGEPEKWGHYVIYDAQHKASKGFEWQSFKYLLV